MDNLSMLAGSFSTFIFVSSNVPMIWKAYRTRDLNSYSKLNIILANLGNLIYWVYVISLPLGPIWLLHFFYTISSVFMLALLFLNKCGPDSYKG
jgi:hypothetical protein